MFFEDHQARCVRGIAPSKYVALGGCYEFVKGISGWLTGTQTALKMEVL